MTATGQPQQLRRAGDPGGDGVHLGAGAVSVILALDDQHWADDPGQFGFHVPIAIVGSQPGVAPAPKHGVGIVAVVAPQSFPQTPLLVSVSGTPDTDQALFIDENMRRFADRGAHRWG